MIGTIYILEAIDHSVLKIGFTTRLALRFNQLRAISLPWMDTDLLLVGFFPGTREVETELHRRFAEFRVYGDWYKYEPVIQAFSSVVVPVESQRADESNAADLNSHAVALGKIGGRARKAALTPARRSEIARQAVTTYWDRVRAGKAPKPQRRGERGRAAA